jgi:hypothetical protein
VEPNTTSKPNGKSTLFNKTRIGHFTSQEDLPVMVDDDTKMLPIVDDHRCGLKIDGCSKEMMVGIAYCQSRHPTTMQQQQQQQDEMEEMCLDVLSQSILAPNEYEMNI